MTDLTMSNIKAARGLGWLSMAIAAAEIAAPRWLQDELGLRDNHDTLVRAMGAREAAAGVTILGQPGLTTGLVAGMWSRVAGDALDLALLGAAATKTTRPENVAVATALVVGITIADLAVALRLQSDLNQAKLTAQRTKISTDRPFNLPSKQPAARSMAAARQ